MRTEMRLHDLCEPLFQYVCRLNRSARKGVGLEPNLVRSDIQALFSEMRARASQEPGLSDQFAKVELALIYFVDFMIKESRLTFAGQWRELAHDQGKMAGDEEFFDLLDETLKDPSEAAVERLVVYYSCLGLGFTGFYTGQPEYLRKKMMEIQARIRGVMDTDTSGRICQEAYEHVDTRPLNLPPLRNLTGMVVVLVAVLIGVLVTNWILYAGAVGELGSALDEIITPSSLKKN
ncbi:MAG: DotU family type IV/VI secretion system protein [Phycisphaeraceae bacterium]|nr:DotU family type IV/VI secretion system protein [Phycisphaeraceae bacterium]MCW5763382.1 DotU family type IV/VI secretion system protein [Phycisphaeraceae bacterium]